MIFSFKCSISFIFQFSGSFVLSHSSIANINTAKRIKLLNTS